MNEENSDNDIYCSNCSSLFDKDHHLPRMLPECGHTICTDCIKSMIKRGNVICPEDKFE